MNSQLGCSNYDEEGHNFEVSDFLDFDNTDWFDEHPMMMLSNFPQNLNNCAMPNICSGSSNATSPPNSVFANDKNSPQKLSHSLLFPFCEGAAEENRETKERVAFRTKSLVEVLDDGFKWRKYGKKMVKNSPNPRNYYRCSVGGCKVKKRVERDRDDPTYIITTYEGTHSHPSNDQILEISNPLSIA